MALNQLQYDTIMKNYQETRERNRRQQERRLQEVYERVDGYQELDTSTGSISAAFAEDLIAGVEGTRERLHRALEAHRKEKTGSAQGRRLSRGLSGTHLYLPGLSGHRLSAP